MNDEQRLRYSRHLLVPEMGEQGQLCLIDSHALIIGMGGLGSSAVMHLAASGVGKLTLVDDDHVDLSNLQRQVIHTTASIGTAKVESATQFINALNPSIEVALIQGRLDEVKLTALINDKNIDIVLDCTDNFPSRFMINRATVAAKIPLVSASAVQMEAQITVFTHNSGCYRCLFEDESEVQDTCSERGVLGPLLGIIGSAQALEAVKILSDLGQPLTGKLLIFDAATHQWQTIKFKPDPNCPVCASQ